MSVWFAKRSANPSTLLVNDISDRPVSAASLLTSQHQITRHEHPHRKTGPDGKRRPDVQFAADDLFPRAVYAVLRAPAESAGKIAIADVMGGTFTVSNLGMLGVRQFTAIINPPQAAILAVGSTEMRQVWNNGDPQWRPMSSFSLTCDHRAADGAQAARFLATLKALLEAPTSPA